MVAVFGPALEIEHVEQIAYRRTVHWQIGIVLMRVWVRKIIAAASGKWIEMPIAFDELQDRDMVGIVVHDATSR